MKSPFILSLLFISLASCAQQAGTATKKSFQPQEIVSFITVINANYAEKDGITLNGYVVPLEYDQIQKLHRKKIRVTGEVFLVEGLPKDRTEEIKGREMDSWHIASPKIELVDNKTASAAEIAIITDTLKAANATKDGIYFNRYVVNLGYDQIQQLNGKRIRVTGEVTIEKGLTPSEIQRQGRSRDTRHINKPKVEIL